jgi:hypothetical protein
VAFDENGSPHPLVDGLAFTTRGRETVTVTPDLKVKVPPNAVVTGAAGVGLAEGLVEAGLVAPG